MTETVVTFLPEHAGLAGLDTDPRYALLEKDPQYDRGGNLRAADQPDTTELSIDDNDGFWVHRDLTAHAFRFGFVGRVIRNEDKLLDFGSGSTMPLGRTLNFGLATYRPKLYLAVDYGKFARNIGKRKKKEWEGEHKENFDCTSAEQCEALLEEYGQFDAIASFEVVEHIFPGEKVIDYYQNAYNLLKPGGRMYTSTPVVERLANGNKVRARNHVHEFTVDEFENVVKSVGFDVIDRFGTFANFSDIKKAIYAEYSADEAEVLMKVYDRCREFYSDNILANFLAPAFPLQSRNQFLILERPEA